MRSDLNDVLVVKSRPTRVGNFDVVDEDGEWTVVLGGDVPCAFTNFEQGVIAFGHEMDALGLLVPNVIVIGVTAKRQ